MSDAAAHDMGTDRRRCTTFTTQHGITDPPTDRFCFGFVCPYCGRTNPVIVDPPTVLASLFACLRCRRVTVLDTNVFEQFANGVRTCE